MAFQILLNFSIAIIWMFMNSSMEPQTFIIGYLIGIIVIYLMRRFFPDRFYLRWVWSVFKLAVIFLRELMLSNLSVLHIVLRPRILDIKPVIFTFPTDLKRNWEITLLSSLITLTPGTLVIHVSEDQQKLYIHAIDVHDIDKEIESIKHSFEKAIKEVGDL